MAIGLPVIGCLVKSRRSRLWKICSDVVRRFMQAPKNRGLCNEGGMRRPTTRRRGFLRVAERQLSRLDLRASVSPGSTLTRHLWATASPCRLSRISGLWFQTESLVSSHPEKLLREGALSQGSGDVVKALLFSPFDCLVNVLRCRVAAQRRDGWNVGIAVLLMRRGWISDTRRGQPIVLDHRISPPCPNVDAPRPGIRGA